MDVIILSATLPEQAVIASRLEEPVSQIITGRRLLSGSVAGRSLVLAETGMGAVNTAHSLTCALQLQRPGYVFQIGVGGAYVAAGIAVGDLAVADSEQYGDVGVRTENGWQSTELIGIPLVERDGRHYFNRFPCDPGFAAEATDLLSAMALTESISAVHRGPFVTVQECSGTRRLAEERAAVGDGAICENMEGAAAAHICLMYGVPFLEVRGISNLAVDRDRESWDFPAAANVAQRAAIHLISEFDR